MAVAVLAVLALARFALFQAPPRAAPPPPAPSVGEQVSRLERVVEQRPADVRSWQALGVAYTRRASWSGDPAYYDLAARAFDRAESLLPSDPETTVGRGALALSLHEFADALQLGRRAHAANRFDPDALAVIVDAEVELGRYEQAVGHLQQMLDLDPGLPALSRTSHLRELYGRSDSAVRAMRQAEVAASQPADIAVVAALLGDLHFSRGELEAAEMAYQRADRFSPDLPAAAIGRARVLAARGRRAQAIELLQDVVERFPQPAAVILLGDLQSLEGRQVDAAESYELVRAIAKLQRSAGSVTDLEMALFEADRGDRPRRALTLARRAYRARPGNVYAADALAWALHQAGHAEAAVPLATQALRLGTDDALLRFHAAAVYAAADQPARARDELRSAFTINPWFSFVHRDRARALAEQLEVATPAVWDRR